MSDTSNRSWVHGAPGAVHTGSGNIYYQIGLDAVLERLGVRPGRPGPGPRQVAEDELKWLKRCFVAPLGSRRARDLLDEHRLAVVTGPSGSGRRTTAMMLLHERTHESGSFHELLDQSEDGEGRAFDPEQVSEQDRLLLDLSAADTNRCRAVLGELSGFRATVRTRSAHLAVVLPEDHEGLLPPALQPLVARIQRPNGREVLLRHLRAEEIPVPDADLSGGPDGFLQTARMENVGRLARRIQETRESCPEAGFAQWLASALRTLEPGNREAAEYVDGLTSGPRRALLLSVAFLHGTRPDTVHHAASELLRIADHPRHDLPVLVHDPLTSRLRSVRADISGDRVEFDQPNLEPAIRRYCWDSFPPLRPVLRTWIEGLATEKELSTAERSLLVAAFTEEYLRTGPVDDLVRTVDAWAGASGNRVGTSGPAALALLQKAVLDERHGGTFRRRLYDWSRNPALPHVTAEVLIGICSQDMARRFPDQAMVRLRHLSRHHDLGIRKAVHEALLRLTRDDRRLYRQLLRRIVPEAGGLATDDAELFLHLADARLLTSTGPSRKPLLASGSVEEPLARGWSAVLSRGEPSQWADSLRGWLDTTGDRPRWADRLLSVLTGAGKAPAEALGRLHVTARDWAYCAEDDAMAARREETLTRLWPKITAALATPVAPSSAHAP